MKVYQMYNSHLYLYEAGKFGCLQNSSNLPHIQDAVEYKQAMKTSLPTCHMIALI